MATKWCKAWSSIEDVPCFCEGHTSNCKVPRLKKIVDFHPDWAFPDCHSSLNSPMVMKWCTKLEATKKRCPIVFEGHLSNLKVTRLKKVVDFDPNGGSSDCNSSLFTNGYQMMHKAWSSIEEVPYCFWRSYVTLQGHTAIKIVDFDPNWACNPSLNSPMLMKWCTKFEVAWQRCPIVFQGHTSNCKVTMKKKCRFWPELSVSGL